MNQQTENQWLRSLQLFLNRFLVPILPNDQDRFQYLTSEAMTIWAAAFTHESYSAENNYENLEYLGDTILDYTFTKYLMKRFPNFDQGKYTELTIAYMSKVEQGNLSIKLGFDKFIRVAGADKANFNLATDVFESFFGALDEISNLIIPGIGMAYCYNMLLFIFKDINIDVSKSKGSHKTQTLQIFTRFGLSNPDEISSKNNNLITFIVRLNDNHMQFLRGLGINIKDPQIGMGTGKTKKEAESIAYDVAFNTLGSYGVTTEWSEKTKRFLDFQDPTISPYVPAARNKLMREGFVDMYYFISRKTVTVNAVTVQLMGIRSDGSEQVLETVRTTDTTHGYRNAKSTLIQQYINN